MSSLFRRADTAFKSHLLCPPPTRQVSYRRANSRQTFGYFLKDFGARHLSVPKVREVSIGRAASARRLPAQDSMVDWMLLHGVAPTGSRLKRSVVLPRPVSVRFVSRTTTFLYRLVVHWVVLHAAGGFFFDASGDAPPVATTPCVQGQGPWRSGDPIECPGLRSRGTLHMPLRIPKPCPYAIFGLLGTRRQHARHSRGSLRATADGPINSPLAPTRPPWSCGPQGI